eukprot:symbB.v1.2.009141.t1/scaffold548.1/size229490/1
MSVTGGDGAFDLYAAAGKAFAEIIKDLQQQLSEALAREAFADAKISEMEMAISHQSRCVEALEASESKLKEECLRLEKKTETLIRQKSVLCERRRRMLSEKDCSPTST